MPQVTKEDFDQLQMFKAMREMGTFLTPDELTKACAERDFDPEKIGQYILNYLSEYYKKNPPRKREKTPEERKKHARKPQAGTLVILLNTDMSKAKPLDESTLTEAQKQALAMMRGDDAVQIRKGQAAIVVDIETRDRLCEFNMEHWHVPKEALASFARSILPRIIEKERAEREAKKAESDCKKE